ncbi:flagellin [Maritimibacter alkaliphilus]|uniref:flagellin N-terminal helical domain-containing protein n=1 Tax=Maritimibacter alkaliphilus TaxID=404236 RepID=UPI001C961574|nr:flagellin [Maritimibacter alkaliphilus]MBY6090649.1 flagellin [Maritimibacter alkaliphilus]
MSSILTNNSAMVALQTLKSVNKSMTETQSQISTGKRVADAKDNSAVWAISKVMESDVAGFKSISESLSLGESTVATARAASETVTDLLTQMKGKIIGAQEENVDRNKLQTDIQALSDQIESVVTAAQFNGLNLLQGSEDVEVLSSLDRANNGTVSSSSITVARQDLTFDAGSYNAAGTDLSANATASAAAAVNTAITETLTLATAQSIGDVLRLQIGDETVAFTATTTTLNDAAAGLTAAINAAGIEGISASATGAAITLSSTVAFEDTALAYSSTGGTTGTYTGDAALEARAETVTFSATAGVNEGDGYRVTIGSQDFDYVAGKNETFEDVANGLKVAIDAAGLADISTAVTTNSSGQYVLQVDNDGASLAFAAAGRSDGEATGGLAGLSNIDVTTDEGTAAALQNIETYIDTAIDAAASFGSVQGRIETQSAFIGKLTDSLKSGIGSLVDANMEETSARLQALQVQQQLAIQAMAIANQAPQSLLSLFG